MYTAISVHEVKSVQIEPVHPTGLGSAWRVIKVETQYGIFELTVFSDKPENLQVEVK